MSSFPDPLEIVALTSTGFFVVVVRLSQLSEHHTTLAEFIKNLKLLTTLLVA